MPWFSRARKPDRAKAERLVTEGYVHAKEGRLPEALRAYEAACKADETMAVAHLDAGLCRLDLRNGEFELGRLDAAGSEAALDDAAAALERAVALEPPLIAGWRALARIRERRGAWAAAQDAWSAVIEHAPADGPERAEAQKAHASIARKAEADRARQRALAALVGDSVDEQRAAVAALVPFLDEATVVPRGAALCGVLLRRAGDAPAARQHLEAAVAADKEDIEALRDLASLCMETGDMRAALAASLDAYRARPTDAGLVCNVGVCHLALGSLDEAAELIDIAERLDPKDAIIQRARDALKKARAGA